jgi:DNA-binding MarR family transcriptional regulator
MQSLTGLSKRRSGRAELSSADACAGAVLDVAPAVVRFIRRIMLSHRSLGLSVPQFRTLALLSRCPNVSLSSVADNIGSSLPAASRMIGVLVAKQLVARQDSKRDRRQLSLALTARGAEAFRAARHQARRHLAAKLVALGVEDREHICESLRLLGGIFGTDARALDAVGVSQASGPNGNGPA